VSVFRRERRTFPFLVESTRITLNGGWSDKVAGDASSNAPAAFKDRLKQMQVGSPEVKVPLPHMPVCTLEVHVVRPCLQGSSG
jgi:hypothetical protein